jgi:hypothetical protein
MTATSIPIPTPTPIVNRTLSGKITINEIWRGELTVTGDVIVTNGATLTIEPGTTIRFTAKKDDRHAGGDEDVANMPGDPPAIPAEMISLTAYEGTIVARGTPEQPITFTSDSSNPEVGDWASISEENGFAYLDYVIVEYSYWGLQVNSNIPSGILNVSANHSIFRHIATCGICPGGNQILPEFIIADNQFIDCRHEGVDTYQNQNFTIRHNLFVNNPAGVNVEGEGILIEGNTFENNVIGVNIFHGGNATISRNEFVGNQDTAIGFRQDSGGIVESNNFNINNKMNIVVDRSSLDITAVGNWWGTVEHAMVDLLIWDKKDQSKDGLVIYEPLATEPLILDTPK